MSALSKLYANPADHLNLVGVRDQNVSPQLVPIQAINTSNIAKNIKIGKFGTNDSFKTSVLGLDIPKSNATIGDKLKVLANNSIKAFEAVDITATVLACLVLKASPATVFGSSAQSVGAILAQAIRLAGVVVGVAAGTGIGATSLVADGLYTIAKKTIKGSVYVAQKVADAATVTASAISSAAKATGSAIKNAAIASGNAVVSAAKATGAAVKNAAIVTGDALVSAASTTYKAAKVASYAIGSGLKSAAKHTAYGLAALVIGSVVTPFDAARILFGALLDAKKLIGRDSELVDAVGELAEIATRNDSNEVQEKAANIKRTLNRSMIERTMDRIEGSYSKTFIKNLIGNGGNHVYAVNRAYEDLTSIFKKKSVDTDQQSNSSNDSGIVQNDDVFYDVDESHETL